MKYYKIFLAFGLGSVTAIALHLVAGVSAQQKKGVGPNPLESRLNALEKRAKSLEQTSTSPPSKTVVAPFVVTDPHGDPFFQVSNNGVSVLSDMNSEATMGAVTRASSSGGMFVTKSSDGERSLWLDTDFGVPSFSVHEKRTSRIELGKGEGTGTYRLKFVSGTYENIAGIGEDSTTRTGLVLVYDKSGILRDRLSVGDEGKGLVDVLGVNKTPLVQLTDRLLICSVDKCDPAMVEAGDAGGYGIVRAGPHLFHPGVTFLGLPGSVIEGKAQ